MSTYYTGSSNYPQNYDVIPSGTGVATVLYVLDEIRNNQGIITQSGNAIVALQLNGVYTILQTIEEVLGINPQGSAITVADRFSNLESTGSFLRVSGGSMFGDLNMLSGSSVNTNLMSGSGVVWTIESGLSIVSNETFNIQNDGPINLVALSNFDFNITGNTVNLYGNNITSQSQNLITIVGPNGVRTSGHVYPIVSGINSIGLSTNYYSNIYSNTGNIISLNSNNINANYITAGTGSFHAISGLSPIQVLSDLNLESGINITSNASGTASIGSYTKPFSDVYLNNILSNNNMLFTNALVDGANISVVTSNNMLLSAATGSSTILAGSFIKIAATGINLSGNVAIEGVISPIVGNSGVNDLGTNVTYFKDIYVNNIYSPSLATSGMALTTFVTKSGSAMTGSLNMTGVSTDITLASGNNITNGVSGINSLGSPSNPFSGIFATTINSSPINRLTFNESLTGATNGINKQFYFQTTPNVGSAMVFVSGLLISTAQYAITGSGLLFSVLAPGQSPISTYGHL